MQNIGMFIASLKMDLKGILESQSILEQPVLHEVIPHSWKDNGATLGFALAIARELNGPCLWVQAKASKHDLGGAFGPGLKAFGVDPNQFLMMEAGQDHKLLAAMEEGLTTPELGAVIGVLPAASRAYDLTASRRLTLRAQKHGVPAIVLRQGPGLTASAAHHRWEITSASSVNLNENISRTIKSLRPRWHVGLTKSRTHAPAQWIMEWNHETHSLCVAALSADRTADTARTSFA